jgi:hypothetical protein
MKRFFHEKIKGESEKQNFFYRVPGVHLSLKQNLHFFMRKNEVNPMGSTFILLGHVSHRPNNLYIGSSFSFCSLVRHSISYIDIDD